VQALFCDIRFAATDAKLTTSFARLGLPAEEGLSWLLPRLIGLSRALDLLLPARVILGAEAETIGLVDHALQADEVLPAAIDYTRALAGRCSPTAMATIKAQLRSDASCTIDDARDRAFSLMLEAFKHRDQQEGARALTEGRSPEFAPLDAH
jgi:enoyl-CoA hydratase/carnithine racemase